MYLLSLTFGHGYIDFWSSFLQAKFVVVTSQNLLQSMQHSYYVAQAFQSCHAALKMTCSKSACILPIG